MNLDDFKAGIYQHYKGPHYLVLGIAHDADAAELYFQDWTKQSPEDGPVYRSMMGRIVVVYVGLELDGAKKGPRMAVRTFDWFNAVVHTVGSERVGFEPGSDCHPDHVAPGYAIHSPLYRGPRFTYVGATLDSRM